MTHDFTNFSQDNWTLTVSRRALCGAVSCLLSLLDVGNTARL